MPLGDSSSGFGAVSKAFHWVLAAAVLFTVPVGFIASDLAQTLRGGTGAPDEALVLRTLSLFSLHKTLGVAILFVAALRLAWRAGQPRPGYLGSARPLELWLARFVHALLLTLLVLAPLAGWMAHAAAPGLAPIRWPFGQTLPFVPTGEASERVLSALHRTLVFLLLGALILHLAGVLKHLLVDRDATLRRMLPWSGATPAPPGSRPDRVPALAAIALVALAIATVGLFGR